MSGAYLQDILPKLKRQILDVEIEVTFKRRSYKGISKSDTHRLYITNINSDILGPEDLGKLYGARWDWKLE